MCPQISARNPGRVPKRRPVLALACVALACVFGIQLTIGFQSPPFNRLSSGEVAAISCLPGALVASALLATGASQLGQRMCNAILWTVLLWTAGVACLAAAISTYGLLDLVLTLSVCGAGLLAPETCPDGGLRLRRHGPQETAWVATSSEVLTFALLLVLGVSGGGAVAVVPASAFAGIFLACALGLLGRRPWVVPLNLAANASIVIGVWLFPGLPRSFSVLLASATLAYSLPILALIPSVGQVSRTGDSAGGLCTRAVSVVIFGVAGLTLVRALVLYAP